MMTRPGALWDHRAFAAMSMTAGFTCALDWAGALLTDAGLDLAGRALSLKVLPMVDFSLRKYAYMRHMNQAIFFAYTGILAVSTLGRLMECGGDGLDWYVNVLRETVDDYILPDGGTYEGPAYHDASISRALEGFAVAAQYWKTPLEDLIPPALLRSGAYYQAMASTAHPGACVCTSDGGRVGKRCAEGGVPFLARITQDPQLARLTAALCQPDASGTVQGALALLTKGPQTLPEPAAAPPVFAILEDTGMLCCCRPTEAGPVRLQLVGAKANAGHSHEDKGSFVLEAFGEELLLDRGTCFYGDGRSELLKHAWRHNVLTADDAEGRPLHQRNPVPEPILPSGSGDEVALHAEIDTSAAWPEVLAQAVRTVASEDPGAFELTDRACRTERGTVSVHFQSRFPWVADGRTWVSRGTRAAVTIAPQWEVDRSEAGEDLFDSNYTPVFRLSLHTKPGVEFVLRTSITVEACRASA